MKEQYLNTPFQNASLALIGIMDEILVEYTKQGFILTVRQLYYQLVARGHIENTMRSYKRITSIVNDARLAGLLDWDALEDRTRSFDTRSRWESGAHILRAVSQQFHMDLWKGQDVRPFVVVEKEALAGILQRICHELDVPLLASKGYPSVSVLRDFAKNTLIPLSGEQEFLLLHLGDHDPSGIDMTRDLIDRLTLLTGGTVELKRLALNMNQVEEQQPPPNPAKVTDSRFESYEAKYGDESWELDALQPAYLTQLVRDAVTRTITDKGAWADRKAYIAKVKSRLLVVAEDF